MTGKDYGFASLLTALAVFIWVRDLTWVSAAGDALPILAGLPLFIWLGWPWRFTTLPFRVRGIFLTLAAFVLVIGVVTELTLKSV